MRSLYIGRGTIERSDLDDSAFGTVADRTGFQLRRLDLLSMGLLSDCVTRLGVTPARATALSFIDQNEGCDQVALARALGINPASAMAAVNELVALGAVERRPGRDRRSNALRLTAAGAALRAELEDIFRDHEAAFFGCLTPDESETFRRIILKLRTRNAPEIPIERSRKSAILRRIK
jgi:DNA-binding MarR family transcriptional regulator